MSLSRGSLFWMRVNVFIFGKKVIICENDDKGDTNMREAITFYGDVHRKFIWLHSIVVVLLIVTSVYWFIVPYFIVQYGNFHASFLGQIALALLICVTPSIVTTLHCWVISFYAARKWSKNGSFVKWLLVFQSFAITVSVTFTAVILSLFVVIDFFRFYI